MSTPIRVDATVKFDSKVLTDPAEALEPFASEMFKQRRGNWMAIVQLSHVERTEPGPDEDKDPSVKIRITQIEVAGDALTQDQLRHLMRDLYERRTSDGTLDEVA
ncbi:hypothetical protein [Streptomyces xanthophaeus]|uniref:hypothetical protein n=1 Tax=Streptomyces xanthophaeus TaxID=67385 RepID=UPI002647D5FB|nr:hypothetical protein [Streptomyces xanthophaeus]WKD36549.1 hypothetical protein KO717_34520 [Streptomyces xanthophaeus]